MGVARIYKTASPYPHTEVKNLDSAQSADAMYFTHLDYDVRRLTRENHTEWMFTTVTWGPTIAPPATPSGTANKPNMTGYTATNYSYKITAVGGKFEQESRPSGAVTLVNDLTLAGNTNVLTLPAKPAGVDRYIVYKEMAGAYGYIGGTDGTSFTDGSPQIQPVLSDTPPVGQNPFAGGNNPSTVTFHDQRLMLGGSRTMPNAVWGSHPADFENMDYSRPAKPDDALSFALVAERVNSVHQLVSMDDFMVLSTDGIFSVNGGGDGLPLTPSAIQPKRQNSRGASRLNPIVLDDIIFYMAGKGTTVRTLGFQFEVDGYQSNNVSIFSPHFLKGHIIINWAYVEEPYSAIFLLRNDGVVLCFTWEAEQQVWGFTMLETEGVVKEIGAITEGGYDRLYLAVERVINGQTRLFHERLALPHGDDIRTACHLDCSVTQAYDPPSNVVGGLSHLDGHTVSAYYDGFVASGLTVEAGELRLPNGYEASIVTVGLPYVGEIETLPPVYQSRDGSAHLHMQNVAAITMRCVDTRGLVAGITGTELEAIVEREGGETGLPDVAQRDYKIPVAGSWKSANTVTIRQEQPLPAHITGLFIEPRVSKQ